MRIIINILFLFFLTIHNSIGQIVVTVAGQIEIAGHENGPAFDATFNNPHGIAIDENGNVYTADRWSHLIRKITPDGMVSIFAGLPGISGDLDGDVSVATFYEPWGICVDKNGDILVADTRNNKIRKITQSGIVSTVAGSGNFGASNGIGTSSSFGNPTGIEVDANNNIYVADHLTHAIRKIDPVGVVTTFAGTPFQPGAIDGPGGIASFYRPYGLTLDASGNIFVADEWNHKIRKITPSGIVTTFAGDGALGSDDGEVTNASFNYPWDVTIDSLGNVFVADGYNYVIRKITTDGMVNSFVGALEVTGATDGMGAAATFSGATSIAISPFTKEIFVGDAYNHLVRKIIDLNQGVSVLISGNADNDICNGEIIDVFASPDTYTDYFFYVDGELAQSSSSVNFSTSNLGPGSHQIQVVVQDDGNTFQSSPITINVHEPIDIDFTTEITNKSIGQIFEFELSISELENVLWDFGDNNTSTDISPTHIYALPGEYSVSITGTDINGCQFEKTKENYIIVTDDGVDPPDPTEPPQNVDDDIFIPNAFTPNGDGENDIFFIRGSNLLEVTFSVFNEWGEEIFQSMDQMNGWNGEHNGTIVQNGNYVYCATYTKADGTEETVAGRITVLK